MISSVGRQRWHTLSYRLLGVCLVLLATRSFWRSDYSVVPAAAPPPSPTASLNNHQSAREYFARQSRKLSTPSTPSSIGRSSDIEDIEQPFSSVTVEVAVPSMASVRPSAECPTCGCNATDLITLPAHVTYGMWTICDRNINASSIVYAIGIGEDNSWDEAMLKRYPGMHIWAMDPVPKAAAHVAKRRAADIAAGGDGLSHYHYEQVALSKVDGDITLYLPKNPNHVSASVKVHSAVSAAGSITVPAMTLSTMMKQRGHTMIDILKIDVEGVEFDILPMQTCQHLPVHQLLVEFHDRFDGGKGAHKRDIIIAWMESCGYTMMHQMKFEEYTFVRRYI